MTNAVRVLSNSEASIRRHLQPLGFQEWVHLQTGRTKERRRGVRSAARLYSSRKAHCSGMSGQILQMYIHPIPSHHKRPRPDSKHGPASECLVLSWFPGFDRKPNGHGTTGWGTTGSSTGWSFGASKLSGHLRSCCKPISVSSHVSAAFWWCRFFRFWWEKIEHTLGGTVGSPRQEKQKHSTEVLQYRARVSESWLFFHIFSEILPSEDEITRGPFFLGKSYCISVYGFVWK